MSTDKNLPVTASSNMPTSVPLSPTTAIDLSWIPEDKRSALLEEHARGMLEISRKAQENHVDVAVLQQALHTVSSTALQAAKEGNSVTASHVQTTSMGRTEVIMGNTDAARVGKLTKSQTGEFNWTPVYVIVGIIALVLIARAAGS